MRIFAQGNWQERQSCPICLTTKDGPIALLIIDGTQNGYTHEAKQVHIECLTLRICLTHGLIYQKINTLHP